MKTDRGLWAKLSTYKTVKVRAPERGFVNVPILDGSWRGFLNQIPKLCPYAVPIRLC